MKVPNLAIALGDPAGVGISTNILTFLHHPELLLTTNIFIFGHPQYYSALADKYGCNYPFKTITVAEAQSYTDAIHGTVFHIYDEALPHYPTITPGIPSDKGHRMAYQSLENASVFVQQLTEHNICAALVTNPLNKAGIVKHVAPNFIDQTKFLTQNYCAKDAATSFMMKGNDIHMVFVTSHIRLNAVAQQISCANIVSKGKLLIEHLQTYEGIPTPVIGVLSLNPHAGEAGMLGTEEIQFITPAVLKLQQSDATILGPLSNDRAFNTAHRNQINGYICMYHDQGIVPLNTIDEGSAVNVTLGLNFIRTSPGHGTAYDIAGTPEVNYKSFYNAVQVALKYANIRLQLGASKQMKEGLLLAH